MRNPQTLVDYSPFSSEVYGETKPNLVDDVIQRLNITPNDCFIDLGSGIGTVVLQVAAQTLCSCYGVELRHVLANYAKVCLCLHVV